MSERENILGRIREALQTKAPLPGSHTAGGATTHPVSESPAAQAREWAKKP